MAIITASAPSSLPPSGAASGDLTGTYPGPTIAATKVVKSIAKAGSTALKDAVTLTGGTNVTLTQAAQDISIAASGSSQPGAPIVRGPFSFAFNTPGINDGVTVYTPTVGDVLLDVWWEVNAVFDGTTPFADVGTFVGQTTGLWHDTGVTALSLGVTGNEEAGTGLFVGPGTNHVSGAASITEFYTLAGDGGTPVLPGRFTAANPLKVVVSQDGTKGGAAVGGAAGAGKVYIVTATPVAF